MNTHSACNQEAAKDEEDDDDVYADLSILLEGSLPSTIQHFEFELGRMATDRKNENATEATAKTSPNCLPQKEGASTDIMISNKTIRVALHTVDDDPGSIRSGHCLWPAAPALCNHLIHQRQQYRPKSVMELGAGCGLVSLAALQLYAQSLEYLVISDRDPTVLERARSSYETTLDDLYNDVDQIRRGENTRMDLSLDCDMNLKSIPVIFECSEWGHRERSFSISSPELKKVLQAIKGKNQTSGALANTITSIDLILGSDLIDCIQVVEPLLTTAAHLMHGRSIFVLSSSFAYEQDVEQKIQDMCNQLNLERSVLIDGFSPRPSGGSASSYHKGNPEQLRAVKRAEDNFRIQEFKQNISSSA